MAAAARTALQRREGILAVTIAVLFILIVIRAPEYLGEQNIDNLLTSWGFLAILAIGQMTVLLTGGIDLSQASVLAFTGMFLALLSQISPAAPAIAFVLLGLLMGAGLGLLNGIAVAWVGIPPIIATLGTMTIIRGLVYVLSGGAWISSHEMSERFKFFAADETIGLPNVFLSAIVCCAGIWFWLHFMRSGRDIYAFGSNQTAARNAGISRKQVQMLVFVVSGAVAGLCGYLWAARFAIAYTQAAEGREFAIIAACVIGGVSIMGGRGTVVGA
ncbi:MAG: ABC transporter permease, partial [Albidovulum sp.]|nr:ABC transporter permease [Albidovulum sp.]